MEVPVIYESEYRFCLILWEHQPIRSKELVQLCQQQLGWKATTTYTVIKRLSDRGVVKNENTVVTALISREQAEEGEIDRLVEKTFEGSLPAFLAAFTRRSRLSEEEIDQLQSMIDRFRQEAEHE